MRIFIILYKTVAKLQFFADICKFFNKKTPFAKKSHIKFANVGYFLYLCRLI